MGSAAHTSAAHTDGRSAKELLLAIINDQPDGSSYDDVLRQLAFHRTVLRGLADAEQGEALKTDELRQRIKSWPS